MKQTTLEDLYYGNINPNETSFVRGFRIRQTPRKSNGAAKRQRKQM